MRTCRSTGYSAEKNSQLAEWIRNAEHFIVFTGAGVSILTGIESADVCNCFRAEMNTILSTGLGVWELRNHSGVTRSPITRITATTKTFPSANHMALVEFPHRNLLRFVISQNTDGLRLQSGLTMNNIS
ncbi:unnamed protein product [Adineta ricciae]|uniref:protein acetyllysine N-acetyltransferase n=1 Tax=Adineta ricciae TaxID=249248 RepID=A0A814QLF2_ADIRI|nr:unnamed protein product [Adineta ricciae]